MSMIINVKMAVNLARLILKEFYVPKLNFVRNAHRIRGKPPGVARTLQQRIEHYKNLTNDELFNTKINIGFPSLRLFIVRSEILMIYFVTLFSWCMLFLQYFEN